MKYIVIDQFEFPSIITDREGTPLIFNTVAEAREEAMECQEGIVYPLTGVIAYLEEYHQCLTRRKESSNGHWTPEDEVKLFELKKVLNK